MLLIPFGTYLTKDRLTTVMRFAEYHVKEEITELSPKILRRDSHKFGCISQ